MASLKNLRHGRIRLLSGDTPTPLTKFTVFTSGDFSYTENTPVNVVRDRGKVREAEYGPHKSLSFRAGDGAGRIEIESFSGDVRIRSGVR